jgi:hypothetical protein
MSKLWNLANIPIHVLFYFSIIDKFVDICVLTCFYLKIKFNLSKLYDNKSIFRIANECRIISKGQGPFLNCMPQNIMINGGCTEPSYMDVEILSCLQIITIVVAQYQIPKKTHLPCPRHSYC